VAEFVFTQPFIKELAAFEKSASARDIHSLEDAMATIAQDPNLPGRVPSFYDPSLPSYLYRSGHILIHYRTGRSGVIEFLNLFWPRI